MAITPVFLLSLPRSGSTVVQKVISAHDGVASVSEPWILLPFLTPFEKDMPLQSEQQAATARQVEDFASALPGGEGEFLEEIRQMVERLYERVSPAGATHFLDKTPHYYLVVDRLIQAFPDARFVFLWRNPLSVVSSFIDTFGQGRFTTAKFRSELFHGVHNLVKAYEANRERSFAVRYEDLMLAEEPWRAMMDYIGLPFQAEAMSTFKGVELSGRIHRNFADYDELSRAPMEKWRRTLSSSVRIAWSRRYVRWIGPERLAVMGYDGEQILRELDELERSNEHVVRDVFELAHSAGRELWRARMPGNRLVSSTRALATVGRE